jgi:serine protease
MLNRYLATVFALLIVAFLPASAVAAETSFTPLTRAVSSAHVGKRAAADLRRGVHRARNAYRQRHYCASVKSLGRVVERAGKRGGGGRVERAARSLQRAIFVKRAAHRGRCGLAPPRFRVADAVTPAMRRLPALADGHPRVVARLASAHGVNTDFVQDELVVEGSRAAAAKLAGRWHGRVLDGSSVHKAGGEVNLIRVDASRAPTADLAADLIAIDPRVRGRFQVSSRAGLGLIAVAADAAAHGLTVAPNLLTKGAGVLDRSTAEGTLPPNKPGDPPSRVNAFGPWYTASLGTGDAWRALAMGGKTSNRVKLAVLDGGFSSAGLPDLSPASTGADDVPNGMKCTGGNECPWHGTEVASAAAGVIDNGLGAFGSGGQVADVVMFHIDGDMFSAIGAVYDAADSGAKIINISSGYELDASVSFFSIPYEDATQTAFERGALVVASAGNDGRDVDAEDCFVVCWEEEWVAPCENDPVICVGGIGTDSSRDAKSNYGREACATARDCDVDIFGPMNVWVGPTGDNPNPHRRGGTSFSSPFVAGVLAMIMAADPSVTPAGAKQALLDTAERSADETVSRIVNAVAAVMDVADNKLGPLVEIAQADPKPHYGGFNATNLKATVDSIGPCKCTIEWSSDKDGAMGTGASIDYVYQSPGRRTVTAKVTDADTGATAFDQVDVEAMNDQPEAQITKPAQDAHVYSGQPFKLEGHADDANQPGGLACDDLWWAEPGGPTDGGCSPTMTLYGDNLTTWVTLKATDAYGAWSSYTVRLHVDKPPAHSPPLVTILSPSEGELLEPNDIVTLEGSANDPDTGPVAGTWSVKYGSTTKTIGQGNTLQWKPSSHVQQGCGDVDATLIFSATDPDGTSSDQVSVKVDYPVC